MEIQKTEGLIAAPPTAFRPDGTVNLEIIPKQAKLLHENGVVGAFVNGTTGEGLSLTVEERAATAEAWVKASPEGFRVIIHVAHTSPVIVAELATHAAKIGAFGIAEMGPVFFKPKTPQALAEYSAKTAAFAPELPYYFYHIPSMSHIIFPVMDFLEAAKPLIPNLAGIKFTYENLMDYASCVRFCDKRYDLLFGRDEILLSALALGARGAIGSTYNIMAPLYNRIIQAFDAGQMQETRRLQLLSIDIIRVLIGTGSIFSALKEITKIFGLDMGSVRQPLADLSPVQLFKLKADLDAVGFWEVAMKPIP